MDKKILGRYTNAKNINNVAVTDLRLKSFRGQIKSDDFSPIKTIKVDASEHSKIILLVLNDIHIGSPGCNIDKLIRYLKQVKNLPNCYIILNGDLMNNANNLGKSSPLENALSPMNEQKVLHTIFSDPIIKEKIICSTSGNHESGARAKDSGLDSLVTPMATLGLMKKYARYMAKLEFKIKCHYTNTGYADFKVLVRHGSGIGGNAGKIMDEMFNICKNFGSYDMVVQGHTHKNIMATDDVVIQEKNSRIKKSITPVNVPALEETSQYAMEAAYPPPNTDNSLLVISAIKNDDMLDSYLNDGFDVLPYKFNIDTYSLDRPELVSFGEKVIHNTPKLSDQKLNDYIDRVAKYVTNHVGVKNPTKKVKTNKTNVETNVTKEIEREM